MRRPPFASRTVSKWPMRSPGAEAREDRLLLARAFGRNDQEIDWPTASSAE
jgi:hypothetical protein